MKRSGKRLIINIAATALLVIISGRFTACETEDWMLQVNCDDCYGYKPDSANLIVYLTIDSENDSVPLTFYRGNYEDGEIDWQDTATTSEFYLYSKMNKKYTVRATYRSGDKIIEAFDADEMHIRDAADECGSPCYIIKGGIFDLRLPE
jgi:hypothetical protein